MFPWIKKDKNSEYRPPSAPENIRIYAVGDIHGRYDLLQKMHALIMSDALSCNAGCRKLIIYIGDYIDRGVESNKVIDFLANNQDKGFDRICLRGNHEHAMLCFLENPYSGEAWLAWGGTATMRSYGVHFSDANGRKLSMDELSRNLRNSMPESHLEFLKNLPVTHVEGDYLFVHAGIKPYVALENQDEQDMMMIREEFIYSDYPSPDKTVIFGHTIFDHPFQQTGKIAIDTGAYATGKLTAAVLEGEMVRFIST